MQAATTLAVLALAAACAMGAAAPDPPQVIFMHLADDFGWANAGWHRPEGFRETQTPNMQALIASGIELDQAYSYQFCSPTRCALQSGRLPTHVNVLNLGITTWNPDDPVSGFAGIPRNMTGIASKLKLAGYKTHQIGKWDAGMATWDHTPYGRGYDSSLNYFAHANNYWNEQDSGRVDFWDTTGPANKLNASCYDIYNNGTSACHAVGTNPSYTIGPDAIYEEKKFLQRILDIIDKHNSSERLFINYDSHIVHSPLQVPEDYYHKFDFMTNDWDHHRQLYASMVHYLDDNIGQIVGKLKEKGYWDNTLWFDQSDNGGPSYTGDNHTANNFPLRGAKYTNWQGGIRVNAYVSGGYLQQHYPGMVGKKLDGMISIADYYGTFCALAGVDPTDTRAAEANLPPIDSLNMWPYLSGQVQTSPRTEIFADFQVLLSGKYKILAGHSGDANAPVTIPEACFPGVIYPNATDSPQCTRGQVCPNAACLYDLEADPIETNNLSGDPAFASVLADMKAKLLAAQATFFNPKRTGGDPQLAKKVSDEKWGGFWGPFVFP